MTTQPEALRLADELADWSEGPDTAVVLDQAAAELRRLYLVEQALDRCRVVCDATSEGWRADAERWQAQRDALLEALRFIAEHDLRGTDLIVAGHMSHAFIGRARDAIAKAEENT